MQDTGAHEELTCHTDQQETDDPWLTIGQAAKYMHLSQSSLRRYDEQKKLIATRTPGGQRRYRRSQLDAWLNRSDVAA